VPTYLIFYNTQHAGSLKYAKRIAIIFTTDRFVTYNIYIHRDLSPIDYHNFTIFHIHRISLGLKPINVTMFDI